MFNFQPFPEIITDRLILKEITSNDADSIFYLRSDPEMNKYLDRDPMATVTEAIEWISKANNLVSKNEGIDWGIYLVSDPNKLIGAISYWRLIKEHYRAELGYLLHQDHQGKGIMSEAMIAVIDYGFNKLKLHSIEANINPDNQKSISLLERHGFVKEGHFRENYHFNGKFVDSAIYSLINSQSSDA